METTDFEALFTKCYAYCMPVLKRKTSDIQLAEDAFLEAITIYWMKVEEGSLKHQKNIPSFVCTISIRLLFRKQQKLKNNFQLERFSEAEKPISEIVQSFFSTDDDYLMSVQKVFGKLGEKCQDIILSKYVYNHSYKDIVEDFGITSVGTAKTMTHRCLNKLKSYLNLSSLTNKISKK